MEILRQQEMVIAALIADGFPPPRARAVAAALLDRIAKRGMDDPALKTALSLLDKTD